MHPELTSSIEVQPSLTSPTTSTITPPETLEELKARHKKEQRELTAKVTALKKTATKGDKKKKKEVLIEIAQLEQSLGQQHDKEEKDWLNIHKCDIGSGTGSADVIDKLEEAADGEDEFDPNDASIPIDHLILDPTQAKTEPLPQQSHGGKKPSRQKARKDRKAQALKELQDQAEVEAAGQVNMNEVERKAIEELAEVMNVTVKDVTADGHCLYNAIADQLTQQHQTKASVKKLRQETAEYMRQNSEDFLPFLTNTQGDMMSTEDFVGYCNDLETTAVWGGQPEVIESCAL
ncbi:OTU domain-containing protein 6B [Mortierella polycephala]|uniref:OTU domain-containing protein 6B n=1 Tax=Mortierella polycephala TaxID=41804 RepID=A0A9P6TWD7_9FUNG|nr:OTU domain-containing protein 6B [Mortierella polycephala]